MPPDAAEALVTGHTPTTLLASRVRKARRSRACAKCCRWYAIGELTGYVDGLGWCCVSPCITGPAAQRRPA